jgi:hypothetical protein
MLNISEKYALEHKDEFEQLDYSNLGSNENCYYKVLFNGKWSNCDIEANANEGWINIIVFNVDPNKHGTQWGKAKDFSSPYIVNINGEPEIVKIRLHGDVIIFKTDPVTEDLIRKVNNATEVKSI